MLETVSVNKPNTMSVLVASIPHGSSLLTTEMAENRDRYVTLSNNDWFLSDLFNFLYNLGITTVSANYSRYVVDVNRNLVFRDANDEYTKSLVYQKSTFGRDIYKTPLSDEDILKRIEEVYRPFHKVLSAEISHIRETTNRAFLTDLHSFGFPPDADVVLETCHGKSCSTGFLTLIQDAFIAEGFSVKVDVTGLTGGFIVSNYGSWHNVEAVQIEIAYRSYIEQREFGEEEVTTRDEKLFQDTKVRLARAFETINSHVTTL